MNSALEACGLPARDIEAIRGILRNHPTVEQAILYGSRAKGTHRPGSDIDLTLTGDLDYQELLALETELDDLLLPWKMDISLRSQIDKPDLLDHIDRVGTPLYTRGSPAGARS